MRGHRSEVIADSSRNCTPTPFVQKRSGPGRITPLGARPAALRPQFGDDNHCSLSGYGLRPLGSIRSWGSHRRTNLGTCYTRTIRPAIGHYFANCNRCFLGSRVLRRLGSILSWDFRRRTSLGTCDTSASCVDRDRQPDLVIRSRRSRSRREFPRPGNVTLCFLRKISLGTSYTNANLFEPLDFLLLRSAFP
jgi:hypothetical protein